MKYVDNMNIFIFYFSTIFSFTILLIVVVEFEFHLNIPRHTITKTIINSGDNGAWSRLERGEMVLKDFAPHFSRDVSKEVISKLSKCLTYMAFSACRPDTLLLAADTQWMY